MSFIFLVLFLVQLSTYWMVLRIAPRSSWTRQMSSCAYLFFGECALLGIASVSLYSAGALVIRRWRGTYIGLMVRYDLAAATVEAFVFGAGCAAPVCISGRYAAVTKNGMHTYAKYGPVFGSVLMGVLHKLAREVFAKQEWGKKCCASPADLEGHPPALQGPAAHR